MKNFFYLFLVLSISAPVLAANCQFNSDAGKFSAKTVLREEVSPDGKSIISYADTNVKGYEWSNIVLVKNSDGSIPASGTINFPKVVFEGGWWQGAYAISFKQEIKDDKIIFTRDFSGTGYKRDTFTSVNTLNQESNSLSSVEVKEVLKEFSDKHFIPRMVTVGRNEMKCTFN